MRPPTPEELAALPSAPETPDAGVLAPANHPRLLSQEDLERGRANVAHHAWAQDYLASQKAICDSFAAMSDQELRALVPKPGSLFVMGLEMNLDPVHGKRMTWAGWKQPFQVRDGEGRLYPNEEWSDSGTGHLDSKSKKRFFFVALANGSVMGALEREVLPALADVYALTQSRPHAHAAAVLLDAIAAAYPGSIRGPLDYPMGKELRRFGGRLDRPTQQVARGLTHYAQVIDLIAASGELETPSALLEGQPIRVNVAKNLLWDGGNYCLLFANQLPGLGNGTADLNHGAAIAGLLLNRPEFCEPLVSGPKSIYQMARNNLARQAFYFEASPGYEFFTIALYRNGAELIEALRRQRLTEAPSLYRHPGLLRLFTAPFQKRQVGGHIPLLGNTRVDIETVDPASGIPGKQAGPQSGFRKAQWLDTRTVSIRSPEENFRQAARDWLEIIDNGRQETPGDDRWAVFCYAPATPAARHASPEKAFDRSTFYGGKGLALLRGGTGGGAHGLQLFFGPSQVKSQDEALTWTFFNRGAEWSYDPGRFNAHFRFGWSASSVAHQSMVVDRENVVQSCGTGHLQAFADFDDTQWVLAAHPGAYKARGVTRFERFLAQVQGGPGGDLLYWLDIGRVEGGGRREDSFHTQMREVALEPAPAWASSGEGSLLGARNLGDEVRGDYRLKGANEGFYWRPPGDGYGFLGSPRVGPQPDSVRSVWSKPAFFDDRSARLTVDFPAANPDRTLTLADGPKAVGHPRVPYLLRSDSGPGGSLFAKVIHFTPSSEAAVTAVRAVPLPPARPGDLSGAWIVDRTDGMRDLWIVNDRAGNPLALHPDGFPRVETDAAVALVRLDPGGSPAKLTGESASYLRVENGPSLSGPPVLEGEIEAIGSAPKGVTLKVRWNAGQDPARWTPDLRLINVLPGAGQPSSWRVSEVRGEEVCLEDASTLIGGGKAAITSEGWLEFPHELSRLRSGGALANAAFAEGKPVFSGERLLGRITEIREDAQAVKVDRAVPEEALGDLEIREIAPGDRVRLPLRLRWEP